MKNKQKYLKFFRLTFLCVCCFLNACDEDNEKIRFEKSDAPKLTYTKQTLNFSALSTTTTHKKHILATRILAGVNGEKKGYTVKKISLVNQTPKNLASVEKHTIILNTVGVGTVVFDLLLQHPSKKDATVKNCTIEITKDNAPALRFTKRSKAFSSDGKFTVAEILAGVQGTKTGYTVKNITTLNPSNLATVTTEKELKFSGGVGNFTATLILQHPTKKEAILPNCAFEITKGNAPVLRFTKRFKVFSSGGKFTVAEILAGVQGTKTGYTIKNITTLSSNDFVTVTSTKELNFKNKAGIFTATIILRHPIKADVTLPNCAFEITKLPDEKLKFQKVSQVFSSGGKFTVAEILAGVQGPKNGYTVKNITTVIPSNLATVSADKELLFKSRAGIFTATIILQHPIKADVTLPNCAFEITKLPDEKLKFQKVSQVFSSGGKFTLAEILAGVQGPKNGYTVKNITTVIPSNLATVSADKELLFKSRAGIFTATIILRHPIKADVTLPNCAFEITKLPDEKLKFQKVSQVFSSGGKFTVAEILDGVQGPKNGYTIKNITTLNPSNLVTVSADKELLFKSRAGIFTATIILRHPTKADVTLLNCAFEITRLSGVRLYFKKVSKAFSSGGKFTVAEILDGVQGPKNGYTVKNITTVNPSNLVTVSASKELTFSDVAGIFTATIILRHPTKADVNLPKCAFEITKLPEEKLKFTRLTKQLVNDEKITTAEILKNVQGNKNGYTVKKIQGVDPFYVATVSGKELKMSHVGDFTADIILQHPTKKDATILKAAFKITKAAPEKLGFQKVSKPISVGGKFHSDDILKGVTGDKIGYFIKRIENLSSSNLATISSKPSGGYGSIWTIDFAPGRVGSFTVTLVLEHLTKLDVTLSNCTFEIVKAAPETLTFTELKKKFTAAGGSFSTAEILGAVQGTKAGYTLKSIGALSPNNLATVTGTAPNLNINFTKPGAFTAEIILEHPTKKDVTIPKASFYMPITWDKTFGGSNQDQANAMAKTSDGGFIMAGYSESTGTNGEEDFYVVKLDEFGNQIWANHYGGLKKDIAHSIIQTSDGDYVIAGETKSKKATAGGYAEFWVLKLNANGTKVWDVAYGKKYTDVAYSVIETRDRSFVVAGSVRESTDKKLDFWILKLKSDGTKVWDKNYGGNDDDIAYSVVQTSDGGYAVAGSTKSSGSGKEDIWVMKLAPDGTQKWEQKFGGTESDIAKTIAQTTDGGYIISGETKSKGAGHHDFWVLKISSTGIETWDQAFGGSDYDRNARIIQTTDGGYALAGYSGRTSYDGWLLKLNDKGEKTWEKFFAGVGGKNERIFALVQTAFGGYALAGYTDSKGAGGDDFWILKVDKGGNL